jgi:hypothetical protein
MWGTGRKTSWLLFDFSSVWMRFYIEKISKIIISNEEYYISICGGWRDGAENFWLSSGLLV